MAQRLDEEPPERRLPRRWDDFLPQMLANAAGTLLAAVIVYVYAVLVGLARANWKVLAPILLAVGLAIARIIEVGIETYLAQSFRGGRHTMTVKNDGSCSRRPDTATRNMARAMPLSV
jgi:hypothetical protein